MKKLLYKAIKKCWSKTPRRALRSSLGFLPVWGRWKWIISTIWIAHFVTNLQKKIIAHVYLQLNVPFSLLPYEPIRFYLDHSSPSSESTYFMDDTFFQTKERTFADSVLMFPLGFKLFILLQQVLQEAEKLRNQWENWYRIG